MIVRHVPCLRGAACRVLFSVPLLALRLGDAVPTYLQTEESRCNEFYPELDFHTGYHDLVASTFSPVRACVVHAKTPPSLIWPFARMRLRMSPRVSTAMDKLWLYRTHLPVRRFCRFVTDTDLHDSMLGVFFGCSRLSGERCQAVGSETILGTPDLAFSLPSREGCILIDKLPIGTDSVRVMWEEHVAWDAALQLLSGLALVCSWKLLRESPLLHAAIGGLCSLFVVCGVAVLWITRSMRDTLNGINPLGRVMSSMTVFLCAFVPAVREAVVSALIPSDASSWWEVLDTRDPLGYNLPIVWIAISVAGLVMASIVMLGARYSVQIFATPPDPEGYVEFYISSDGSRVDNLPAAPLSQRFLGWVIWAVGLLLILTCSTSDGFSATVAILAGCKDYIFHVIAVRMQSIQATSPASLRHLWSRQAFEEKGRIHTDEALRRLRQHVSRNPRLLSLVSAESQHQLRRFSDHGLHYETPFETDGEITGRCCIVL